MVATSFGSPGAALTLTETSLEKYGVNCGSEMPENESPMSRAWSEYSGAPPAALLARKVAMPILPTLPGAYGIVGNDVTPARRVA